MSDETVQTKEKFFVAGIITTPEFQKARFLVNKLYNSFPQQYFKPKIRPMLNVEWEEFLTKMKRTYGNGIWVLKKQVLIFLNDQYLGDEKSLTVHLTQKFRFSLSLDWYETGKCHLVEIFKNIMEKFRQIAYMTISINHRVIGSLVFELYCDLVPLASEVFLERCKDPVAGYSGKPIHRIVKNSWIQCAGWDLPEKPMRCENYVVPHDRRGVLCTTNNRRHKNNTSQFFITLAPTPWMDTKYVAFGQLLQGEEVLKKIEEVPTYYEAPVHPVEIVMSGEITLDRVPDYLTSNEREEFQALLPTILLDSLYGPRSDYNFVPQTSKMSIRKFKKGIYGLETDMKSYLPFVHLPDYLMPHGVSEGGPSDDDSSADDILPDVPVDRNVCITPPPRRFRYDYFTSCSVPGLSDTTIV